MKGFSPIMITLVIFVKGKNEYEESFQHSISNQGEENNSNFVSENEKDQPYSKSIEVLPTKRSR